MAEPEQKHRPSSRATSLEAITMRKAYLWFFVLLALSAGSSYGQAQAPVNPVITGGSATDLLDGIEIKRLADLERRLKMVPSVGIADYAQAIAEVDEWLYAPEDEKPAKEKIEIAIETLRTRIEGEITSLSKEALDAPNGKTAGEKLQRINALISLYPAPQSEINRSRLEKLSANILSTTRRVDDIRRLRYNEWAVSQIQTSLDGYRRELAITGIADAKKLIKKNRESLLDICISAMSLIDPGFLEPAVMDLYNYTFGLTRDAMGSDDANRVKLAKGFANPATIRKTPRDF